MRFFFIVFILLLPPTANGKTLVVQFDYNYQDNTKSYNLYLNDTKVCNVLKTDTIKTAMGFSMDCIVATIPDGINKYTLTAIDSNDRESKHSPIYSFPVLDSPYIFKLIEIQ